ncbi:hypothetical protein HWV62_5047 [Athelia sp. TMB]|nr:hypothetical protein HWV62_5047 [Athelia sp. TMB]
MDQLSVQQLNLFTSIIKCLREHISWHQDHTRATLTPLTLPASVLNFCADALEVPSDTLESAWEGLGDALWAPCGDELPSETSKLTRDAHMLDVFLTHGTRHKLGLHTIIPPIRACLDIRCETVALDGTVIPQALSKLESYEATLFTRDIGPIPVWSSSASCRNYYTHESGTRRTYYHGVVPSVIEVSKHRYVERVLCERFTLSMATAWVSATNSARIYNLEAGDRVTRLPRDWGHSLDLSTETVWDAFFLNGLILDAKGWNTALELRHDAPDQATRLRPALEARNKRMVGPGQELWNHACNICCDRREKDGIIQMLRSAVSDGVALGHPCCKVHDCKIPLDSQRHHYCGQHQDKNTMCAVVGCDNRVSEKHSTCTEVDHRKLETRGVEAHTAMFQLRRRLERLKIYHPDDEVSAGNAEDGTEGLAAGEVVEIAQDDHPNKPESGNQRIRARFGRRRTHNEQLCVATCGVIFGRATMYGSEGVNGVRVR